MAASSGNDPPPETIGFDSNFSIREIAQKSRVFCRDSVGGRAKNEEVWKNFDSTWSGKIFDGRSAFFKTGFWAFWGNMTKIRPKTAPKRPKTGKNGQKWIKSVKPVFFG